MNKPVPKSYFFVSLPFNSWQFHKQLIVKSESRFGFKSVGNHSYI